MSDLTHSSVVKVESSTFVYNTRESNAKGHNILKVYVRYDDNIHTYSRSEIKDMYDKVKKDVKNTNYFTLVDVAKVKRKVIYKDVTVEKLHYCFRYKFEF